MHFPMAIYCDREETIITDFKTELCGAHTTAFYVIKANKRSNILKEMQKVIKMEEECEIALDPTVAC